MLGLGLIIGATLTLAATALGAGAEGTSTREPAGVLGFRAVDTVGRLHRLGTEREGSVALVFIDVGCPISNRYAPRLNELANEAAKEGIEFFGILSDPTLSSVDARKHTEEYELVFPVLLDGTGDLAARLDPTHVPEAFVIDKHDRLVYRGRIDDRFVAIGKLRKKISSHDLLDAIHGVAAGEGSDATRTDPVGCVFEAWDGERPESDLTYNRDVAPILSANCVECHRTGDIAPFPLETYADVRKRARMISLVCTQERMPPWFAEPGVGSFRDERSLSARQIATIRAWANAGATEGDPADLLPPPPKADGRWRLGEPDLLVEMPVEYEVPASGDDIYRYFVIPSELTEDKDIVAIDFRPGDPAVVHHCIAYMDRTGVAKRIDARSEAPGFSKFGQDSVSNGERFEPSGLDTAAQVAIWAPGTQPYELPAGVGRHLAAGGDFVLEIHYHLTGKATSDRSALALYFADAPVERHTASLLIGTENIDIEAGQAEYWRHVWMDVPTDVDLIDVYPHMHNLGKMVDVVATLPDGSLEPLIRIDDWDFRWQGAYFYRQPIHLPQGSRIDAYFRFDNSEDNPFNPSSPPIRVVEGWRTTDEMCLFFFTVVPTKTEDPGPLYEAMYASFERSGAAD